MQFSLRPTVFALAIVFSLGIASCSSCGDPPVGGDDADARDVVDAADAEVDASDSSADTAPEDGDEDGGDTAGGTIACCTGAGECTELTPAECRQRGGGVTEFPVCNGGVCGSKPAEEVPCCTSSGCEMEVRSVCIAEGGVPDDDAESCASAECDKLEPCCYNQLRPRCEMTFPSKCRDTGGSVQSNADACSEGMCTTSSTTACCLDPAAVGLVGEGYCVQTSSESTCQQFQGTSKSSKSCPAGCERPCCLPDGSCSVLSPSECGNRSGTSLDPALGLEAQCQVANHCETKLPCCLGDQCQMLTVEECQRQGGEPGGTVTADCSDIGLTCGDPVPCCLNGSCSQVPEDTCRDFGGTPKPNEPTCYSGLCGTVSGVGCCVTDAKLSPCLNTSTARECRDKGGFPARLQRTCNISGLTVACKEQKNVACCTEDGCSTKDELTCIRQGGTPKPSCGECP